jgi:nicotinate-nucleotide adenylyltransferase
MHTGLFFGSFNPVHLGHLIVAEFMRGHAALDEVWFVVSPANPFKDEAGLLPAEKRLELVRLAIADNPGFRLCDLEFHLPRPSYTASTLEKLVEAHPERRFSLLMGGDSLETLPRWKDSRYLQQTFHQLLVYRRQGATSDVSALDYPEKVRLFDAPYIDLSATYVRRMISEGRSLRYLVPDSILPLL